MRMAVHEFGAGNPGAKVAHLGREMIECGLRQGVEGQRRRPVGAGGAAEAEVDAAGCDRLQHAELLGDLQRRIVRQHHPGAADADAIGGRRNRRHQDFGRGAGLCLGTVVFGQPVAAVAERLAVARQLQALADRGVRGAALHDGRLVENR